MTDLLKLHRSAWNSDEYHSMQIENLVNIDASALKLKTEESFPKIAGWWMNDYELTRGEYSEELMAYRDISIVNLGSPGPDRLERLKTLIARVKTKKPSAKILGYVATNIDQNKNPANGSFYRAVWSTVEDGRAIGKDKRISPNYEDPVVSLLWATELRELMEETGFDGFVLDHIKSRRHLHGLTFSEQNKFIRDRAALLHDIRQALGPEAIILGIFGPWDPNDSHEKVYYDYATGHLQETTGQQWDSFQLIGKTADYQVNERDGIYLMGSNTETRCARVNMPDPQEMRYLTAWSCIHGSHVFIDRGGTNNGHNEFWWCDEWNADLGKPTGPPWTTGNMVARSFERGVVLLNSAHSLISRGEGNQKKYEWFPQWAADIYANPKLSEQCTLPKRLWSTRLRKWVGPGTTMYELLGGIPQFDADILVDRKVKSVDHSKLPRWEEYQPRIEELRDEARLAVGPRKGKYAWLKAWVSNKLRNR